MSIEELKEKIESGTIDSTGLIFVYKDRFLADQYTKEIAKLLNKDIEYVDELESDGFFGLSVTNSLSVFVTDEYNQTPPEYCIVLAKKSKNENAIEFPKVASWCVKDYLHGICSGVEFDTLDKFLDISSDLYRLQNEIDKIAIFDEELRNSITNQFLEDGVFSNLSSVDTFEFINAIQNDNEKSVAEMYRNVSLDPFGFVGLLYKQFSNMVVVYLQQNPTESNTGLKEKQIWAIKNVCKKYTRKQILDVYKFLSLIDFMVKSGELSTDIMFDYVLFKVLFMLRSNR